MKPWHSRHWITGNETETPEKWETNEMSTMISPDNCMESFQAVASQS